MFGNPASFKGSGVVQPVVWPMMKGNKVYVGRGMVCQEVLPFIEGPTVHTQGNSARERMWKKGERGARGRGPGRLQEIDGGLLGYLMGCIRLLCLLICVSSSICKQ